MTERILAFALLLWPLAALADAGYFCSFETSPMDCGFKEQAKVPGRASLVDIARDGSKAVRLYTEPGDNGVRGSGTWERNDLTLDQARTGCYEGAEQWWAHSVLFPGDYVAAAEGGVVAAFHHTGGRGQANFQIFVKPEGLRFTGAGGVGAAFPHPGGRGQATFQIFVKPGGLRFTGAGGPSVAFRSGDPGYYQKYLGPLVKNRWYDFVYHVKWSSDSDGFMFAWVNGVQELAHRGPTLYAGQGCYFKLANYHAASGAPSAVIHDRVVRGSSAAEVSLTPDRKSTRLNSSHG